MVSSGGTVSAGVSTLVNAYGTLTVNTSSGAYLFTPNAAAIEGLDVGENPSLNFTFTVSDGDGPTVNQGYTINITGADDTPTLAAVASGSIAEVNQSSSTTSSGLRVRSLAAMSMARASPMASRAARSLRASPRWSTPMER